MSVTTKPPTTVPATVPPSNVVPFSMPWGGAPFPPGCCPPGGMDALMQCYCDVQKTLAFMSQIMQTLMTTDPAVQAAMVAGIEKSGSAVPLIGVTNGVAAQPGQVGEFVDFVQTTPFTTAANQSVTLTMGVLQPGDWDVWAWAQWSAPVVSGEFYLVPDTAPPGFSGSLFAFVFTGSADDAAWTNVVSTTEQALISVPTLIAITINTNQIGAGTTTGTIAMQFRARRRR